MRLKEFKWGKRMKKWLKTQKCGCYKGQRGFPSVWTELRRSEHFCDGVIESKDGKVYKVHRIILASASDYFRVIFTSPISNSNYARLPFSSEIVNNILDFCYTGCCRIDFKNVQNLLPAADEIGVIGIIDQCSKFLIENLCTSNCYGVYTFAKSYHVKEVEIKAKEVMTENFLAFYQTSEFREMDVGDFCALLKEDKLNVRDEETVFYAIDRWIRTDTQERAKYTARLFKSSRLGLVSLEFFNTVILESPYIKMVDNKLLNLIKFEITDKENRPSERNVTKMTKPRIPHEVLFAVGGWSAGSPTNCVETYDIRADRWFLLKQCDKTPRSYHGLVALNNLIYMIGGFDGFTHFSSVRCFDPASKKWSDRASMNFARCYVSCVTYENEIYAIGGFDGRSRMDAVEKYSLEKNQWTNVAELNRQRSDSGAAVANDKIYVVGGFNGQDVLNSAEVFDIKTSTWTMLPPMNEPRSGVALVFYKGYLYALGGFNGIIRLNTVERLNPECPTHWATDVPDMLTQRSNFACVVMDDMIYAIGGFNGHTTTAYMEHFDGIQWQPSSSMNLNRSALAACVCRGLPNSSDYTLHSRLKSNDAFMNGDCNATGDRRIFFD